MGENFAMFKRLYICLGHLKMRFLEGYKPFIGLDGCFLKGKYGMPLTSVGCDVNWQIIHLFISYREGNLKIMEVVFGGLN